MSDDYRESHLRPGYGKSYDKQFSDNPLRSIVWQLEQEILNRFIKRFYKNRSIQHLDFACGTGRVLSLFANQAEVSVGVDLSPAMLEVAREKAHRSEIIEADITKDNVLGDRKFNLITAFRFFPNAQPALRQEVMSTLVNHLQIDGYLVFNNHRNLSSLTNRVFRLLKRGGKEGMALTEVKDLLSSNGLIIEKTYHMAVIPATEEKLILPRQLKLVVERFLSRFGIFKNISQNIIFVCKRIQ